MKTKLLVPAQTFGIGDIIFCQTIANDFIKGGYKVLWPVEPQFVEGLNRAYPNVMFIDRTKFNINYENKEFKEIDGMMMLPMRYSEHLMGKPYRYHMESKYSFLGKDWKTWKEGAMFERNKAKEKELFAYLEINESEPFNLISTTFGSNGQHKIDVDIKNGYRTVRMSNEPGFSLFDWAGVIEKAAEIHAVSSASLYIFELLDLKCPIHLYCRKPIESNFDFVEFIFSKPYILHK
jgi:hypothetical protein